MKNKNKAIVTLCIGEKYDRLGKVTHPSIKAYANKVDADFIVIDTKQFNLEYYAHFEKFQLYALLNIYDRILFLDTDILVTPKCPNLFDVVAENQFGAFIVSEYTEYHNSSIKLIQEELGDIGWVMEYFNSGVMVVSKHHREVFNMENGLLEQWSLWSFQKGLQGFLDQTLINYNVQRLKLPIYDIGYRFNHTTATKNSEKRFNSYIIHYPGKGHRRGDKIHQIQKDLTIINNKALYHAASQFPLLNRIVDRLV